MRGKVSHYIRARKSVTLHMYAEKCHIIYVRGKVALRKCGTAEKCPNIYVRGKVSPFITWRKSDSWKSDRGKESGGNMSHGKVT